MSRTSQFRSTLDQLENIITCNLSGNIIADQIAYSIKYCIAVESGKLNDLSLIRKLCSSGLPFRDIEAFDKDTLNSVYKSYEEMKKLLKDKSIS